MRVRALASALALSSLFVSAAWAHKLEVQRVLMLEPEGQTLHVLVHLRVPKGDSERALMAMSDLNRDGTLEPGEEQRLEKALLVRALHGVRLWVGTRTATLAEVRSKLERAEGGGAELMVYGHTKLPREAVDVEITTEPTSDPIEVRVVTGSRLVSSTSRGDLRAGQLRARLQRADAVRFRLDGS